MIIIEGMDNSGKTTLAEQIKKFGGDKVEVVHGGGPVEPGTEALRLTQFLILANHPRTIILDRCLLISEEVYGPILRGGNALTKVYNEASLWNTLKAMDPLIIYCRPPDNRIFKTMKARKQMDGVDQQKKELLARYDKVMKFLACAFEIKVIPYDYTVQVLATKMRSSLEGLFS